MISLMKGINFGGYLSQCEYDLKHYEEFITEEDIIRVKEWGFDHIRLPIDDEVLETEEGNPYFEGIKFVDMMVGWTMRHDINIILDLHRAYGYDFNDTGVEGKNNLFSDEALKERFLNLWSFMAARYGKFEHVAFELLNEVVEVENAKAWNELIAASVEVIREKAPNSTIIYGGIQWNSARTVKLLDIPKDDNIMFTFHMYEPLIFTHQKAYWVPNMPEDIHVAYPGSKDYYVEKSLMIGDQGKGVSEVDFEVMNPTYLEYVVRDAIDAANAAGVTLYCGEFGVIDRAPVKDTKKWFDDILKVFHKHGIGYALWTYKLMDFGLIDNHYDEIRDDLIELLAM